MHRRVHATDELGGQCAGSASGTARSATGRLDLSLDHTAAVFLSAQGIPGSVSALQEV